MTDYFNQRTAEALDVLGIEPTETKRRAMKLLLKAAARDQREAMSAENKSLQAELDGTTMALARVVKERNDIYEKYTELSERIDATHAAIMSAVVDRRGGVGSGER